MPLQIYSEDGFVLRANMGYYIRRIKDSIVNPTSQDKSVYIPEFISTSRANNNCLVSIEEDSKVYGILRSRINDVEGPYIPDYSVSETAKSGESALQALIRGLKEELGCLIDSGFFVKIGSDYVIVVSVKAKDIIINNYQRLVPFTELYDVKWVAATTAAPSVPHIVQDKHIFESPLITDIDSAWATTVAPLPFKPGVPAYTSSDRSYNQANHNISSRPVAIVPRQKGTPPAPRSATFMSRSAVTAAMAPSTTTTVTWPAKNEGETKQQYINRVAGTGPGKSKIATIAHAETLGFTAGHKTIRRKKLKRSKKLGTLKRSIRR